MQHSCVGAIAEVLLSAECNTTNSPRAHGF
jgi:hypothetical protein